MSRPYTDISKIINTNSIKNGSVVASTTVTGLSANNNNNTSNKPSIDSISQKYGNRFYNGILVNILSGDINGGSSLN